MATIDVFPNNRELIDATKDVWESAKANRIHHYFRVTSMTEAVTMIRLGSIVNYAVEVTPEWYDPPDGFITIGSGEPEIRGSHAVLLRKALNYGQQRVFAFCNSWGASWGNQGWGCFPCEYFDRFAVEAWNIACPGHVAPLVHRNGIVCLEWKWSLSSSVGVHGREIVDAESHERLAWAFCICRGNFLDIDEFFVWPSERGKGYGRHLASMVQSLSTRLRCPIRMWVSFADTERTNLPAAEVAAKLLGVQLGESPVQWAHLCGMGKPSPRNPHRRRPQRPASIMEWLRPKDEAPAESPIEYDVFFGTNRKSANSSRPADGFLNERGNALTVGRCRISVPKTHRFGSNGSKWLSLFTRSSRDTLRVLETEVLGDLAFDLRVNAAQSDFDCKPQNLLYIHGFKVSFDDAMMQAAQFGVDLKIPGRTFVYSWPSAARLLGHYAADEAAVEACIPFLEQFVAMIRSQSPDVPLNVLVHSMGSRAVVRLFDKLVNDAATRFAPIGQVIFAAPDVDHDVFAEGIARFSNISSRTTLYMTRADVALQVSELIHRYSRAGLAPPMVVAKGVDTVLVEDFELLSLGHGYHSRAAAVLHDMFHLIRYDSSPGNRPALREARSKDGQTYWRLSVV